MRDQQGEKHSLIFVSVEVLISVRQVWSLCKLGSENTEPGSAFRVFSFRKCLLVWWHFVLLPVKGQACPSAYIYLTNSALKRAGLAE